LAKERIGLLGDQEVDKISVVQEIVHARADAEDITGNKTLDEEDVGKIFHVTADATITLPSTAVGYVYTLVCDGADGTVEITVSPAAADKIMGVDITDADDKDLVNTKATAKRGDYVKIFGDGSLGWYVMEIAGTWAREA